MSSSSSNSHARQKRRDDQLRRKLRFELSRRKNNADLLKPYSGILYFPCDTHVQDAVKYMVASDVTCALVRDASQQVCGILTNSDLIRATCAPSYMHYHKVADFMTSPVVFCDASTDPFTVLNRMVESRVSRIPICDERGKVIVILDILACFRQILSLAPDFQSEVINLDESDELQSREAAVTSNECSIFLNELQQTAGSVEAESLRNVGIVDVKSPVSHAMRIMSQTGVSAVAVVDRDRNDGDLVGILTSTDIVLRLLAADLSPQTCSVIRIMTPNPDVISMKDSQHSVLNEMLCRSHQRVLVREDASALTTEATFYVVDVFQIAGLLIAKLDFTRFAEPEPGWSKFLLHDIYNAEAASEELEARELAEFSVRESEDSCAELSDLTRSFSNSSIEISRSCCFVTPRGVYTISLDAANTIEKLQEAVFVNLVRDNAGNVDFAATDFSIYRDRADGEIEIRTDKDVLDLAHSAAAALNDIEIKVRMHLDEQGREKSKLSWGLGILSSCLGVSAVAAACLALYIRRR